MFEDECQRVSRRRHGAIARGVAKRGLVAFLAFAMAFGTTPAQLWPRAPRALPRLSLRRMRSRQASSSTATGTDQAATEDEACKGRGYE